MPLCSSPYEVRLCLKLLSLTFTFTKILLNLKINICTLIERYCYTVQYNIINQYQHWIY